MFSKLIVLYTWSWSYWEILWITLRMCNSILKYILMPLCLGYVYHFAYILWIMLYMNIKWPPLVNFALKLYYLIHSFIHSSKIWIRCYSNQGLLWMLIVYSSQKHQNKIFKMCFMPIYHLIRIVIVFPSYIE